MDNLQHIIAGGGIGGLALLIIAVKYQLQKDFVGKESCFQAQDSINQRIDDLKDYISSQFSDVKCHITQLLNAKNS